MYTRPKLNHLYPRVVFMLDENYKLIRSEAFADDSAQSREHRPAFTDERIQKILWRLIYDESVTTSDASFFVFNGLYDVAFCAGAPFLRTQNKGAGALRDWIRKNY